ncbi:MAG: ATP-binding protein [Gemmatimonadetes bacterium]|nr:ATP-binding protein [Gemmatimonadota bacterium]
MRQVIVNLLDNALKYGPAGQTVSLELERIGSVARITVSDQGPGIPPTIESGCGSRSYAWERTRGRPGGAGSGWRWCAGWWRSMARRSRLTTRRQAGALHPRVRGERECGGAAAAGDGGVPRAADGERGHDFGGGAGGAEAGGGAAVDDIGRRRGRRARLAGFIAGRCRHAQPVARELATGATGDRAPDSRVGIGAALDGVRCTPRQVPPRWTSRRE